ncbi:MAG: radical SAM protein [Candidatus Omnitrophota bacterium]
MPLYPSYLRAFEDKKLDKAIKELTLMMESCSLCPRNCRVNRLNNEKGFCKTGYLPKVYSFMSHKGEEPPISGKNGSGTIFFSNCNMGCLYCQNYEFSQLGKGREVSFEELAGFMLNLQDLGCHNINLVTPTHILPQILTALRIAISQGLKIPLVYNTSGFEAREALKLLEGIVDIYLTDMRYADAKIAERYSLAFGYPEYSKRALIEMRRQINKDEFDNSGIMRRGLIIRHLVLPNGLSGTKEVMRFIAEEVSINSLISLMSQYLPYYKADKDELVARRLKIKEYEEAKRIMKGFGLSDGWVQDSFGLERFAGVNIKSVLKNG